MQMSEGDQFRRLGYQAVDMAAGYLAGLPGHPVFQRMEESERQALMNMPMPDAPLAGDEILRLLADQVSAAPDGQRASSLFWMGESRPRDDGNYHRNPGRGDESQLRRRDHAAIYLEHCVVRWLMQPLLGFPTEGSAGLLVSGGLRPRR